MNQTNDYKLQPLNSTLSAKLMTLAINGITDKFGPQNGCSLRLNDEYGIKGQLGNVNFHAYIDGDGLSVMFGEEQIGYFNPLKAQVHLVRVDHE